MDKIESVGRFELKHNVAKMVIGPATTYTFQLVRNGTAIIYGSMDSINWTWIAKMSTLEQNTDSFIGQHTWRYLKADITDNATLFGNRG